MKLVAIVKYQYCENPTWTVMKKEYATKKKFMEDLKLNGYIVKHGFIFTEEQFSDDGFLETLYAKENKRNLIAQAKREACK